MESRLVQQLTLEKDKLQKVRKTNNNVLFVLYVVNYMVLSIQFCSLQVYLSLDTCKSISVYQPSICYVDQTVVFTIWWGSEFLAKGNIESILWTDSNLSWTLGSILFVGSTHLVLKFSQIWRLFRVELHIFPSNSVFIFV